MEKKIDKILALLEKLTNTRSIDTPTMKPVNRSMDTLGRVTIPKEYRRLLDIDNTSVLSIIVTGDKIIIEKVNN